MQSDDSFHKLLDDMLEHSDGDVDASACNRISRNGIGPSRPRRRSLSSDRIASPESHRLRALREESFLLQDSLENVRAESRNLKGEVRDLQAEARRLKDQAEQLKLELRVCYRREHFLDEVRVEGREEGYRDAVIQYRRRVISTFPGIDQSRLPYYVGRDGAPQF